MSERRMDLTASQQVALPAAYQQLQRAEALVRQARVSYAAICAEIGIDPNGHYRIEGDTLVIAESMEPADELLAAVGNGRSK